MKRLGSLTEIPGVTRGSVLEKKQAERAMASKGGLAQITSLPGGSRTRYALACLGTFFTEVPLDPPPPRSLAVRSPTYCCWVSDEGLVYPEALWNHWRIPLSQLLLVKVQSPEDVWRVALETVQTGLFRWVLLRPSRGCTVAQLRKLQLAAEKNGSRVWLLGKHQLPHWVCRETIEIERGEAAPPN